MLLKTALGIAAALGLAAAAWADESSRLDGRPGATAARDGASN